MARGMRGDITDVPGVEVGQVSDHRALTGCTVVLVEEGAVCGADVRGGAPGTRETDLLRPGNLVSAVHAVLLAGGSAFGLDAASGVMKYLEERGRGFDAGIARVPIVPAAILFDLAVGDGSVRPGADMGYEACLQAGGPVPGGSTGAGTGATVGKVLGMASAMRGGTGSASLRLNDGTTVGAIACVNAFGDVVNPATGRIIAGALDPETRRFLDTEALLAAGRDPGFSGAPVTNTTIAVLATDARLDAASATRLAAVSQGGLARVVRPCHGQYDGDTVFVLSTGNRAVSLNVLGAAMCRVLEAAVVRAVMDADPLPGIPSARDLDAG